jgi:His/Glu/Gln/Arg/opine family amino acid ABC transporter permease subunit
MNELGEFCRLYGDIPIDQLQGYGWVFCSGVMITLLVGVACIPVVVLLGLLGAWAKLSHNKLARSVGGTYTSIVRGVPELVLILLTYYGITLALQNSLSALSGQKVIVDINPFVAGVITLGLIYGAFATEVFRGAFLAVDRGQIEAAKAYGMDRQTAFVRVVLPQMLRFALPGLGNVWMVLIKATSLMSVIQLPELMRMADVAARAVRMPFTFYFAASIIYLMITIVSIWALHRGERWASRGVRRA